MNPQSVIPNPGTGAGNPALALALLPQSLSPGVHARPLPPAVVAMPVRERTSLFIPLRQFSSPVLGPAACDGWTSGLWTVVVTGFNVPGVQLAVTELATQARSDWLEFSEALITGPPPVLNSLADQALPAPCRKIDGRAGYAGGVRALTAPRVGLGSRAYEITGTGRVPVWQWAEVVKGPGFVLEVRIPIQAPSPADPGPSLGEIAAAAYHRAAATLSP